MRILFISPRLSHHHAPQDSLPLVPRFIGKVIFSSPLEFYVLASVTPAHHEITVIDDEYQRIDFGDQYDIVGITATTPAAYRAYEIADEFRSKGTTVVLGGWHPTILPDEAKQHADSVVVGEGEACWPRLLADVERGMLQPFYIQDVPVDLSSFPPPSRKRILRQTGFLIERAQAARGCSMGCEYCVITNSVLGRTPHVRPIADVVKEVESIPQKYIHFLDPSFTTNPSYYKQLFIALKDLKKKYYCNGNISVLAHDEELVRLSSDAGCLEWAIGFESLSQQSLDLVGKQSNVVEDYATGVQKIHEYGMGVFGNFMFGFDGDHRDVFRNTVTAVDDLELDLAIFNVFTPFPGTKAYLKLEKEHRILTRDWSDYDLRHVVFQPKHMTPDEVLNGMSYAYDELYSMYRTVKRGFGCLRFGVHSFVMTGIQNFFTRPLYTSHPPNPP
jgi:radical SAM superfamily enzyme YgiQ (UPF0313 family)